MGSPVARAQETAKHRADHPADAVGALRQVDARRTGFWRAEHGGVGVWQQFQGKSAPLPK